MRTGQITCYKSGQIENPRQRVMERLTRFKTQAYRGRQTMASCRARATISNNVFCGNQELGYRHEADVRKWSAGHCQFE